MAEVAEFGRFDGTVVLFGGAVSNAHAVRAMLDETAPGAVFVSTGDHAAYCAGPAETVRLLRAAGTRSIAGNCEESLGTRAADCGCGFAPGTACDLASARWFAHADAALDDPTRAWMRGLPRFAVFRAHGRRWGVLHGGATAVNRYLWPTDPDDAFRAEIAALEAVTGPVDAVLAGHCGIPFRREVDGRLWLNTGALGMPPNDGDPQVSYALLTGTGVELRRLAYDWRGAQAAMRAAGLTQGYERCIETGWWPSEDVLPAAMRRGQGAAARPGA